MILFSFSFWFHETKQATDPDVTHVVVAGMRTLTDETLPENSHYV